MTMDFKWLVKILIAATQIRKGSPQDQKSKLLNEQGSLDAKLALFLTSVACNEHYVTFIFISTMDYPMWNFLKDRIENFLLGKEVDRNVCWVWIGLIQHTAIFFLTLAIFKLSFYTFL